MNINMFAIGFYGCALFVDEDLTMLRDKSIIFISMVVLSEIIKTIKELKGH